MKIKLIIQGKKLLLFALLPFSILACKEEETSQAPPPPPKIQVVEVIQKDIEIKEEFVGQAYGLLDIPIRARVEGFLEGVHFEEGFPVKKGQLLYSIDSQPFMAEVAAQNSKVAEAKTYLINAENELARYEPLAEINAVSKSDLDAARASRDAAEASLRAVESNLELAEINLSFAKISSPINGVIGKTEARVGEFVGKDPNPVILNTVSKINEIRIQFFLTESKYISLMRALAVSEKTTEDKSNIERNLELILSDGSLYAEKGKFDFIGRNVDAMTGSMLVQGTFPNPNGILRPGMYGKVIVPIELIEDAILVPQRCIMELQGQHSVFVVDENNIVSSRQIVTGKVKGDLWLVNEGLEPGEKIVIDGLQKVKSEMEINPDLIQFESKFNN